MCRAGLHQVFGAAGRIGRTRWPTTGPGIRAIVFGGSNFHGVKNGQVHGGLDEAAAKALIRMWANSFDEG